ncbi:membrane protein [Algoriphagus taiwanensis]
MRSRGFLQAKILEKNGHDTLVYQVESGPLYSWSGLELASVPEDFLEAKGQPGEEYTAPYIWIEDLLDFAEDKGLPFAEVKIDSVQIQGTQLTGRIDFNPGPLITWDSLSLAGNAKTQLTYLQLLSRLEVGRPFSQSRLEESTKLLQKSPYFSLLGPPQMSFQQQKAIPVFSLQERRLNVFDGVIGFLPNENEPGKLLVTGQVDLQLYHLGGKGRDISLQWQRLNVQSQALDLKYKESFIFRSPLDASVEFSLLRQDSSFVNRSFVLDFGYRVSDSGYLNFFTRRQAGDLLDQPGFDPQQLPAAIDYRWNQYGIGGEWNLLDDLRFPRRGWRLSGEFSAGNKRVLENTGIPEELYEGLTENSTQIQGRIEAEKHVFFKPVWGMWIRGSGGILENPNLFLNELFRIGGLNSIRGFNEKFFFARHYGFVNLEQRLFFGQNSYLMVFGDFGVLNNPYFSPQKDTPFSFGSGINLDTEGGLFSFVFALGKSNIQPLSFEYARVHFGYLARF